MKTALQILTEAITEYNQHVSPAYKFALTPKESEIFTDCFKEHAKQVAQKALEDAVENARTRTNDESTSIIVDKQSILSTPLIIE